MTDELPGSYITEYVSNGPKNYAYRTCDGKHVVKVKGFTLNFVASQQLAFDVMKEMAISEQEEHIIVTESRKIRKDLKRRQINTLYQRICIRVVSDNFRQESARRSQPHQFTVRICVIIMYTYYLAVRLESNLVCVVHIDILYYSLIYYILPVI